MAFAPDSYTQIGPVLGDMCPSGHCTSGLDFHMYSTTAIGRNLNIINKSNQHTLPNKKCPLNEL